MSDEKSNSTQPSSDGKESREEGAPELSDLPPPAFPPGSRRHATVRAWAKKRHTPEGGRGQGGEFADAFISPDEPIVRKREPGWEALGHGLA